jgi:hypothetical protein
VKPKEYIKKYNLDKTDHFSHQEFIIDLTNDFMAVIEVLQNQNQLGYERFKQVIKEIRQKWDSISNKTFGTGLSEKLWNYFYATVIVKVRDQLFGEYLAKKKAAHEERVRERRSYEDYWEKSFFEQMFKSFYKNLLFNTVLAVPLAEFSMLGLEPGHCTQDDLLSKFRAIAKQGHTDKGGNLDMGALVEAKNKCMSWLMTNGGK